MAAVTRPAFALFFIFAFAGAAQAAELRTDSFDSWLENLKQEAVEAGIAPDTVQNALSDVTLDDHVIELDQKQPETTITFEDYLHRTITPERVTEGRRMFHEYAELLDGISRRYGVQPEVIVALWGIESSYGRNSGDYGVVESLVTLAYQGRRAEFFRKELMDALRILDRQHVPASTLRGSWAGAMGQCQFMPSTYLRYAVSYDNSGGPDIWNNPADVFASIASYIVAEGWRGGETWGSPVKLRGEVPDDYIGLNQAHSLAEWSRMGVNDLRLNALAADTARTASLIAPDGADGRHFLVYDNFRALMHWNRSTFFAASVGVLADRIAE